MEMRRKMMEPVFPTPCSNCWPHNLQSMDQPTELYDGVILCWRKDYSFIALQGFARPPARSELGAHALLRLI